MEGLLNKNNKGQGGKGIFALSSSSPRAEKQGREGGSPAAARAGGSGREGGPGVREKGEGGGRARSPAAARLEAARGGLATTAGGSGRRWRWVGGSEAWWRSWRWGKALGDSVGSITPLTLGRGDAQRQGNGRGWRRSLELGVAALQG